MSQEPYEPVWYPVPRWVVFLLLIFGGFIAGFLIGREMPPGWWMVPGYAWFMVFVAWLVDYGQRGAWIYDFKEH